jgi:hypothetical protein
MADERDPQVSRRYRELGSEEPAASLDDAILAASRRSVASRRRWYLPLAAAAVAALAVGIVLQIERQRPDAEALTAPAEGPAKARPQASDAARDASPARSAPAESETPPQGKTRSKEERNEAQEAVAAPRPIPQTAPAARGMSDAAPERLLERIADLRKQGRHEEADEALAQFKRRYPDYRIPVETLRRIEKE